MMVILQMDSTNHLNGNDGPPELIDTLSEVALLLQDVTTSRREKCQRVTEAVQRGLGPLVGVSLRGPAIDVRAGGADDGVLLWSCSFINTDQDHFVIEARSHGDEVTGPVRSLSGADRHFLELVIELVGSTFEHLRARREASPNAFLHDRIDTLEGELAQQRLNDRRLAQSEARLSAMEFDRMLVVARERRAIAADLHDVIGQALATIRLRVGVLQGDTMFCGFDQSLHEIQALLDQTIEYTRNLSFEISPPVLYDLGLVSALEWLAERMEARHGLSVTVTEIGPSVDLPEDVRVTCFAAAREALSNVAKHSGSDRAWVTVSQHPDSVRVRVVDPGKGFEVAELERVPDGEARYGLFGLRGRIANLGGTCEIASSPGTGTMVSFEVPLRSSGRS